MPELPEVETVLRTLEQEIKGEPVSYVRVFLPKMIDRPEEDFCRALEGRHFLTFQRRGKYLLFGMEDVILVSHLRMEGKYWLKQNGDPVDKHTHVIFGLSNGRELRYNDTRKFGTMELWSPDTDLTDFHGLGPEPFDDSCSAEYLFRTAKQRNTPLKTLLLDQSVIAGIGNIYADEICFACGLRPRMNCRRLTGAMCRDIVQETRRILSDAVKAGGTTIRSYTSSLGVTGLFQLECMVHARKTCRICGSDIKIVRVGGRSSYYCPHCQRAR